MLGQRSPVCIGAVVCCAFLASVPADDWPAYLGPHQDGTSLETELALDWSRAAPPMLWRRPLGDSFSPPVVSGGKLIAFHRIHDEEVVECLDAATGESLWSARYSTRYVDRYQYNGGPRSSPSIDGDRVYTYGAEGVLSCWELATGGTLWQRRLNEQLGAPQEFFGVGTPPVISGRLVLLNAGGRDGSGVVGLDKLTGRIVWRTGHCGASYSAAIVTAIRGQRMALFLTKDGLLSVTPETGQVLHEFGFRSALRESVNAASPVVVDNTVFISAAYGMGSVLLRVTGKQLTPLWRSRETMQNHWATSIHHDGCLYGLHGRHARDAVMRSLDWASGTIRWTSPRLRERLTFIMADGHFIAMGERGHLVLVDVDPDRYIEKGRIRVLAPPCWAPPVLADGLLYVRNQRELLCLDLRRRSRGIDSAGSRSEGEDALQERTHFPD